MSHNNGEPTSGSPGDDGALREVAVVNGRVHPLAEATLPIVEPGLVRGDAGFETIGVWAGRPFRLPDHLARLDATLRAALLPPVDGGQLADEIEAGMAAATQGQAPDAALRLYVLSSGTRIVLVSHQPPRPALRRLQPIVAPWIRPLGTYALAGAKTMSYMPNMTLSRAAVAAGADDALLISDDGTVLEGPTFGVVWARSGRLFAASTDLGIIDSVSRRAVLEIAADEGLEVELGAWSLDDILAADEVMTSSAVRPLRPVERIADRQFPASTPITDRLAAELERRRRGAAAERDAPRHGATHEA